MRIEVHSTNSPVDSLVSGTAFLHKEVLYMKIDAVTSTLLNHSITFNAVNLSNGQLESFTKEPLIKDTRVRIIDAVISYED
jgi:hypothetical protein